VAKSEPKNEQQLCGAVGAFLARRQGESIVKTELVDAVVRDRRAVEAIYHTKCTRFALEHTRIESFPNQIGLGKQFAQLLGPLETDLAGKLPGVFFLIVGVGEARVSSSDHAKVRAAVAAWILENAAALESEERVGLRGKCEITATPAGVPFEVTLHRDCDYDSGLFIMRGLDGDRQQLRREAIARSLDNKCPKLQAAHDDGCISVLILESDDVSLSNRVVVAEAAAAELAKRADQPDAVVWVRTSTRPWKAAMIKDGAKLYPDIDARLFDL
jgi:hypothetical protein